MARSNKSISKFFDRFVQELKDQQQAATTQTNEYDKPEGWMSTKDMGEVFVGDGMKHTRILKKFAESKKLELANAGIVAVDADDIIKKKWVREYEIRTVGRKILCASPKTIAELKKLGLIVERSKLPPMPKGWVSNCSNKYAGGTEKRKKIFLDFAEEKKRDLISSGKTQETAEKIVFEKWVGEYRNGNPPAICVSPQAAALLEERGVLKRKKDKSFAEEVGKKGISPDSHHISERSGRGRL